MKKRDIAMIVLIASLSALAAFAVANSISALKPPTEGAKVKTIEAYTQTVNDPDKTVFNVDAINPTVKTVIGNDKQPE